MISGFLHILKRGMRGYDVADWQRGLRREGFVDAKGNILNDDGDFGGGTEFATKAFQASQGLEQTGVVDPLTEGIMFPEPSLQGLLDWNPNIATVISKNYTLGHRRAVDVLVIHCMQWPDKPDGAERVAGWMAGPDAPKASAHYCADSDSIVRTVLEKDVAWHAPGANDNGIGIEHTGYANWTREQWLANKVLDVTTPLFADLCIRYKIPPVFLDAAGLKALGRGITTHWEITKAFSDGHGHTDPGPNFPLEDFIAKIKATFDRGAA